MLLDASHYQADRGPIDWPEVAQRAQGVIEKITEGAGYVDPAWTNIYAGAASVGLPRGAYHFANMGNAMTEANHFADVYLSRAWQLVPVLDIETASASAGWLIAFRAQFRARVGHAWLRVYSSESLLTGVLNPDRWVDAQTDIWAARYNSTLGWNHPALVLWQNTSAATVPGIVGSVDESQFMNGWTPALDGARMGAPAPVPTPGPQPHPITGKLPANTVLREGNTGAAVATLQRALNAQYPAYSHLTVDGDFGPATYGVVRTFQGRAHLQVDGVAGPQTLRALYLI